MRRVLPGAVSVPEASQPSMCLSEKENCQQGAPGSLSKCAEGPGMLGEYDCLYRRFSRGEYKIICSTNERLAVLTFAFSVIFQTYILTSDSKNILKY